MDLGNAVNQIVNGLQQLQSWAALVIVAIAAVILTVGATHFMRKDERGTEEGKTLMKNGGIAVIIVAVIWLVLHAAFSWAQGIL